MADITKCKDDKCPKRSTCYRWIALACPYRQAYFVNSPREVGTDKCSMYLPYGERNFHAFVP